MTEALPFGIDTLDAEIHSEPGPPKRVRCYVRGCPHWLEVPTRTIEGDTCPLHGIRCHHSSAGGTYVYRDVRQNIIVSADLFVHGVVGHPFKYESHRLGAERSEDSLTWNVFRSLQEAHQIGTLAEQITGIRGPIEPDLYLWGIETSNDSFRPWPLLIEARRRFEANLPVERPLTEPDIAIHLPGRYLILLEAKFTSPNTCYTRGPRQSSSSLTVEELLGIYNDPSLRLLNRSAAGAAGRIYQQLFRNLVFAEWMARYDHPGTQAFHVNLVREGAERESAAEFSHLLTAGHENRFQRWTWETIYHTMEHDSRLHRLQRYFRTKTAGLVAAFALQVS